MPDLAALDRLLARQHGVVSTGQLRELGMTGDQADSWVKRGLLARVRRGVLRVCGAPQTWRLAASSAVLAAGPGAVLSHRSAARLWGLDVDPRQDGERDATIEITAARQRRIEGVTGHRHHLDPTDVTVRHGIPVTTIERTVLDMAEHLTDSQLGRLIDEVVRRRLTTLKRLFAVLGRRAKPGRRRWRPMRRALAVRGEGFDPGANDWEQRMDRQWDRLGLPPGPRQHRVRVKGGHSYVLDRAIVELRIGVEWNGRYTHGTLSGFEYDSSRRGELLQAGWLILDFTPGSSERQIVDTVLAACEERRRLLLLSA